MGRWSWAAPAVGTPSCLELVRLQSSNTTVHRKSLPEQILVFHQNIGRWSELVVQCIVFVYVLLLFIQICVHISLLGQDFLGELEHIEAHSSFLWVSVLNVEDAEHSILAN